MSYFRYTPGPPLEQPFTVTSGIVIAYGVSSRISVRIPAGGTWPGHAALPGPITDHLQLGETGCMPGSTWTDAVTPDALTAGVALITAQALTVHPIAERMDLLGRLGHQPRTLNQVIAGGLLGCSREAFSKSRATY
ncbi:hypothetical protein CBQ26_00745 [Deinococcus indicus]|uniref:Uncharacterized protein n=1 Tax=Deinococcus indicus TaxID=223556 RepID=A0A246BTN9_9DEIO|nr:hypothetical protein [Deinococcus indicus]OWL99020.1 hypothetical protein CBQ26_00745 [Deinococcus indicus]